MTPDYKNFFWFCVGWVGYKSYHMVMTAIGNVMKDRKKDKDV